MEIIPMSPYESILGLSGLWMQHVERHKDIHVWARPSQRPACIHCQHKAVRIKAALARQYFPNVQIVADRFHVVRLVNQHFLKLWQQYDPEGRKNRGLLSLMRRHHWRLSAIQKERLHQYLAHEPVLQALYFAKQQLNGFLVLKTLKRKRAQKMLPNFLQLI